MGSRLVIIGSGAASVAAANSARMNSPDAEIRVFTREDSLPYYRPAITKCLSEKCSLSQNLLRPEKFYADKRIEVNTGREAVSVNAPGKSVAFADGASVGYDRLLLAVGASCFVPPIPGSGLPQVVTLREKTDFDRLHGLLEGAPKKVALIGGGLLGLETAWGLFLLGHEVRVLEALPTILPRQLDAECAEMLEAAIHKNSGVRLEKGVCVEAILGDGSVSGVRLKGADEPFDCDVVVISAGIRSNTGLAGACGLKICRGVVADSRMRSSAPDIFAAGDCAEINGRTEGLWEAAMEQGKVAGANMAGADVEYRAKTLGASFKAFDVKLYSIGDIGRDPGTVCEIRRAEDSSGGCRKLCFKGGRLCGGVLFGDVALAGKLSEAVNNNFDETRAKDAGLL